MKPFILRRGNAKLPLVLSCEHASAAIPEEFCNLGWTEKEFDKCENVLDKGANELFDFLCEKLNCAGIKATFSRLVIDVNRNLNQKNLIRKDCHGVPIPVNLELSEKDREHRIKKFYVPYRDNLHDLLEECERKHNRVLYFAIHTMAHHYNGHTRKMDFAIIYKAGAKVAKRLGQALENRGFKVTYNDPYKLSAEVIRPTTDLKVCRFNETAVVVEMNDRLRGKKKPAQALYEAIEETVHDFSNNKNA